MANITYTLDQNDFNELLKLTQKNGAEVEKIINDYLHNEAPRKIKSSITGLVPVSDRKKKHAKFSDPFQRQQNFNLAVKIITAKEFNYLVFPDEGLGTSIGNIPQNFTGRGLEAVTSELIDDMTAKILQNL